MSNDEIVQGLTRVFSAMNAGGRAEEALEIQEPLALFLSLDRYPIIHKNVGFETCLSFVVMSEILMMNLARLREAQRYVALFNRLAVGHKVSSELINMHGYNDIEIDIRTGNYISALKKIDNWLSKSVTVEVRTRLLFKKGVIENALQGDEGKINSLSYALACAEESKNEREVAQVYQEMAAMFGIKHPALGMSMLRKAENYYLRLGRKEEHIGAMLYRARSCIAVINRYWGKTELLECFTHEANAIVDSIREDDLKNKSLVAYYNWTKGIVKFQLEPIDKSLDYFINAEAPGNICHIAEHAIWIAMQNGEKQKAKDYLELYKKYAVRIEDGLYAKRMEIYERIKREIEDGLEKEAQRVN